MTSSRRSSKPGKSKLAKSPPSSSSPSSLPPPPRSRSSSPSSARSGEGRVLVTLSQRYGWVFLPQPKLSYMFHRKLHQIEPYYEYRIAVPPGSPLLSLLPPTKPTKGAKVPKPLKRERINP